MRQVITPSASVSANGHHSVARQELHRELPPDTLRRLETFLKKQWKRYCKQLKRCQKKFSEEAVHQSRVETRRLLALAELLGPFIAGAKVERIETALKRHLDTFDDLRDTQVQLLAVGRMLRSWPAAAAFHDYLLKREKHFTRQTSRNIKRIKTKRLGKLLAACRDDLRRWRKTCKPRTANAMLLRPIRGAFERTRHLQQRIDPEDTRTIHCTRVAFKKFRYMLETVAPFLPVANNKLLTAMHRHQTMMGEIQDVEVLLQTAEKFSQKKSIPPGPAARFRAELLRRRRWLIQAYLDAAGQLLDFWPERKAPALREGAGSASPGQGAPPSAPPAPKHRRS